MAVASDIDCMYCYMYRGSDSAKEQGNRCKSIFIHTDTVFCVHVLSFILFGGQADKI